MAGEFGISSDEVISLLRQMDVPVRSHLSLLTDDQVARVRARWEREKRTRAEKQAAPATTTRRRRGTAAAEAPPPPPSAEGPVRRRRKAADLPHPELVDEIVEAPDDVIFGEPERQPAPTREQHVEATTPPSERAAE